MICPIYGFRSSNYQSCERIKIKKSIISNQIGRSGTSIGANIIEAQYAHGTADFIAKLQIALKESNETGYWLELLFKTNYIDEVTYKYLGSIMISEFDKNANSIYHGMFISCCINLVWRLLEFAFFMR